MKLTKKFWKWLSQLLGVPLLIALPDLIEGFLSSQPFIQVPALRPLFVVFRFMVLVWWAWLVWRGYLGFCRKMDFLIDDTEYR